MSNSVSAYPQLSLTHMVEGFHWGVVVVSLVFSKFKVLLLIFLDCYFSFIIRWFMYCSVVFAAVERNTLRWFEGVFFEIFLFFG